MLLLTKVRTLFGSPQFLHVVLSCCEIPSRVHIIFRHHTSLIFYWLWRFLGKLHLILHHFDCSAQSWPGILQNIPHVWSVWVCFIIQPGFSSFRNHVRDEVLCSSHHTISWHPHDITNDITLITWLRFLHCKGTIFLFHTLLFESH